jgi:Zn-dependent M28 family amino/carboxypeptidase
VFVEFVGEEMGLYGSRTLAFTPPQAEPFAKGRVVAMINLDMIGRLSSEGLFVGGLSSSSAWMPLLETIDYRGMPVLFDLSISARSDHASFYHQKVPVLFFFTGLHDDYHRASDNPDKLFEPGYVAVTQIVLEVVQKLADGHPLPFTEPKTEEEGLVMAIPGDNPKTIVRRLQGR